MKCRSLLIITNFLIFLSFSLFLYSNQKKVIDKQDDSIDSWILAVERIKIGKREAAFGCPFYIIEWARYSYNLTFNRDKSLRLAKEARNILKITKWLNESFIDPFRLEGYYLIHPKLLEYLNALESFIDNNIKYFETLDRTLLSKIDEDINKLRNYEDVLEKILKSPLMESQENSVLLAKSMCPKWLISLASTISYLTSKGEILPCQKCAELSRISQTLSEISKEETFNIKDPILKEKLIRYFDAMICHAYLEYNYYVSPEISKYSLDLKDKKISEEEFKKKIISHVPDYDLWKKCENVDDTYISEILNEINEYLKSER